MSATSIEWATHVWNPVTGCDRVSPGCANCYALTFAGRLKAMGQAKYQRDGGKASGPGFAVTMHEAELDRPLGWRKARPRVFVNSMSDLFHPAVSDWFIDRVLNRIGQTSYPAYPDHRFLILTKRPERALEIFRRYQAGADKAVRFWDNVEPERRDASAAIDARERAKLLFPNLWLGVSIENRRYVDRADVLRQVPGVAVRFISAEPLLGPLMHDRMGMAPNPPRFVGTWDDGYDGPALDLTDIDWLIVGGESGHRHRPVHGDWIHALRDAATAAGTAFFFKQWGGRTPKAGGRDLDGRTWDELPEQPPAATA